MKYKYLIIIILFLTSCAATRVTTTEHSAVEQALLTYTTRKAFSSLDLSSLKGRKVYIEKIVLPNRTPRSTLANTNTWHEINPKYLQHLLEKKLLEADLAVVDSIEQSDILLKLVTDIAAIDDSEFVMGVPSIPIPLSTGGTTLQTPEISLFSSKRQTGKVRLMVYGKDRLTGTLAFNKKSKAVRKYYTRWSFLIILGWRVTDLGRPF